jgi:microcystin-dependent protein
MSGWLTPNLPAPTGVVCRRFRVPNDDQFLRNFWGAILNLCDVWNWETFGTMTADQASALAFSMYQEAVAEGDWCMVGMIFPFASATLPQHSIECVGGTYLRVDYPLLYAALDAAYIIDADHFTVPDLRDNVIIGAGATYAVAATGGEAAHTLITAEVPSHSHVDAGHTHAEGTTTPTAITVGPGAPAPAALGAAGTTGSGSASLDTVGGNGAHNNLQPYVALRWGIISE